MLELVFFVIFEDPFVLPVAIRFRVIGVFEALFLVGVGGWFVFSVPAPTPDLVAVVAVGITCAGGACPN